MEARIEVTVATERRNDEFLMTKEEIGQEH
jgi:hypothetical protein